MVSSIHVKDLVDMAPAEMWGEGFVYGVDTYDEGLSSFASYYAATEAPQFRSSGPEPIGAVSAGTAPWPEDVIKFGHGLHKRRLRTPTPARSFSSPHPPS